MTHKRNESRVAVSGPAPSLDDRLRAVGWTVTDSGCWEWKGARNSTGYGVFRARALGIDRALAHRVMYAHFVGPVSDDLLVRHKCDNPPCVNPDHLIPGTYLDNSRDMVERGRQRKPKLDDGRTEQARLLASQGMTQSEVAAELHVSRRTVGGLGIEWQQGRPRISDDQASARTLRRRKPPRDPESVSFADAGRMLGVSRQRAYQLAGEGRLERHPDGGVTRLSVETAKARSMDISEG